MWCWIHKVGSNITCGGLECSTTECCTINTCVCANGTAAVGDACTSDRANICASCNTGYTLDGTECAITYCVVNQHVESNACVCPDGTTSLAGADASGDDTDCVHQSFVKKIMCSDESFECETCADGSYNATGDDASQGNTTCDTIMCSSNVDPLRYPDHECGDYGILRSDSATVAGQTNEQCCIPFANCLAS